MRGTLGDLSAGGCYVETIAPQPVGTSLELYLLTEGGEFEVGGLVRHAQPAMGMGVEFVNLKPDKLALITKLLQMMDKNEQSSGAFLELFWPLFCAHVPEDKSRRIDNNMLYPTSVPGSKHAGLRSSLKLR